MPAPRCAAALATLALAGCGGGSQPASAAPPSAPVNATVQRVDTIQATDIGADVVGCAIKVPARHELEIAVVVNRDGAFSAKDSHVTRHATPTEYVFPCRLITFLPHGPLRPDAADLLVLADGWPIRHPETTRGSMKGYGSEALEVGQPYVQIAYAIQGGPEGGWSSDVRAPGNVALGIHVYARIVPVVPGHKRYAEMQANPQASYTSSGPLASLDEVVPPAPATSPGQF